MMKHLEVVAAIIIYNEKILCMQRKKNKLEYISEKYEFPGGKVEAGENYEEALTRELKEEMEIDVTINRTNYFMTISHQYPDFSITMSAYIVAASTDKFVMNDHISYVWLNREELSQLDWAPADIPIVEKLMRK